MQKVIVVGAGIGGLTAAYRLKQSGFDVVVLDKASDVGGRMKTVIREGFHIDVGAGILPGAYKDTKALLKEVGLSHLMEDVKGNCIFLRDGEEYPIDMGAMISGLLTSGLVGWQSKLKLSRMGIDLARHYRNLTFDDLGKAASTDTMTVSEYCSKHFPAEVERYLLGPFVRTMYLHNPDKASLTEMLWCMKNLTGQSFSLKGGMEVLPKTLAEKLDVKLNTLVTGVEETARGVVVCWQTQEGVAGTEEGDFCYIASDAKTLDTLYGQGLTTRQRTYLQDLKYCPDIVVTFCLDEEPDIDAILIQVPENTDPELAAVVLDHKKGQGRVPDGSAMITCHFLDSWGQRMKDESDEVVMGEARNSLSKIVPQVKSDVIRYTHIERWAAAATSAECGTFQALAQFMNDRNLKSRVCYGGDYMALSSVNVSVAIGNLAAQQIASAANQSR